MNKKGFLIFSLMAAMITLVLYQPQRSMAEQSTSSFSWFTCGYCPNHPEIHISGDTIRMGVANRLENDYQPESFHGAATLLPPANQYIIEFDYDLYSWDSYMPVTESGKGYWDSFSITVSSQPIWQLSLSDPITPATVPGLGFIWGGTKWGDGIRKHANGRMSVVVNGNANGNNYLSVVLDTATMPYSDGSYPSWGTITIRNVTLDSDLNAIGHQAALIAQTVVGGSYLWGGKGWNWNPPKTYVSAEQIIDNGYYYYQASTKSIVWGKGLDCSGLVYWSYNKAADSIKYPGYPIFEEGAQGQMDSNTTSVNETDLRPGDLLFFAGSSTGTVITHVAMYVGGSDPDKNVVEAANPSQGIIYSSLNQRKNDPKFRGFGRVKLNQPALIVQSHSPVTLLVTDPNGVTVNSDTYTFNGQEFIRGVPGVLYYTTDENGDDLVYAPALKSGIYTIKVIPKPDAHPDDTFSLNVFGGAKLIELAQNTRISDIPPAGYRIAATDFEINPAAHKVYLPIVLKQFTGVTSAADYVIPDSDSLRQSVR